MIQLHRIEDSIHGTDFNKTNKSKECKICHCNDFSRGFKYHSKICNDCNWGIKSFKPIMLVNGVGYRFFMFDMTLEDVIDFIKDFESDDEFETTLQYERIDISEGIDIGKTSALKECMICNYWYFKDLEFQFKSNICNKCHCGSIFSK